MTPSELKQLGGLQRKLYARFQELLEGDLIGGLDIIRVHDLHIDWDNYSESYIVLATVEVTSQCECGFVKIPFRMALEKFQHLGRTPKEVKAIERKGDGLGFGREDIIRAAQLSKK